MGIGIGTVLMFLCTMILAMYIMSVVIKNLNKIFEDSPIYNDCSFGDLVDSIVHKSCAENYDYDLIIE